MHRIAMLVLFIVVRITFCNSATAQSPPERMLFIIDSIPVINDLEKWNPILQEDIADVNIVRSADTIKQLGWEEIDAITFIFTKAYRNRPDSLKKIPSLKQMTAQDGNWYFHDTLYSGRYIDYYNSGKKQNEGRLLNGRLHGALTVYFKNGNQKSISHYENGLLEGVWNDYYSNGMLLQTRTYSAGKTSGTWDNYFINGQREGEKKLKQRTPFDTLLNYYSTGKVKNIRLIKYGKVIPDEHANSVNYYTNQLNLHLNTGDLKEANKAFYKLWKTDSTSADTYFFAGLLLYKEFRFEEAIAEFDKALQTEPLMRESLLYRGLARLGKHTFRHERPAGNRNTAIIFSLENLTTASAEDQEKICHDFQQALSLDHNEAYVQNHVPGSILEYCKR